MNKESIDDKYFEILKEIINGKKEINELDLNEEEEKILCTLIKARTLQYKKKTNKIIEQIKEVDSEIKKHMNKQIILASNNKGKIQEFKDYLKQFDIDVISQKEAGCNIEVEENGTTYAENALIKAKAIYKLTGKPVISDDSGLEVDFIGGKPGLYTGRFLGENATNQEKCEKILEMLKTAKDEERTARFKVAICFIDESGKVEFFSGECEGKIAYSMRGNNGMGYDPIFEYEGRTFAEMKEEEKNKVSHRGKAIKKLLDRLSHF